MLPISTTFSVSHKPCISPSLPFFDNAMIVRHPKPTTSTPSSPLCAHYDFSIIADFLCDGPKRSILIQMPATLLQYSLDVRRAIDAALITAGHPNPRELFIAFLADNSCGSTSDIPACCCIEGRVASLLEKRDLDGILHFGPACSIVFSLPVFISTGKCLCAEERSLGQRSLPILYVPRRLILKDVPPADACSLYLECVRSELVDFLSAQNSANPGKPQRIGFVFGESVAQYLVPLLRLLKDMTDVFVANDIALPYATHDGTVDFLSFASGLLNGTHVKPHAIHTTCIGLLPVPLDATTYFVLSLHAEASIEVAPPQDMAIHATALLAARLPGNSAGNPAVFLSNAYPAFSEGNSDKIVPTVVHPPEFVERRIRQAPFLSQSLAEAPVVGLFILNNAIHTDPRNGLNSSVVLCKVLRYYFEVICGKRVYEFYFSAASSSSIVDSEAGVQNMSQSDESPAAAFLTKFSHFLPQLSLGVIVTDCVYKILDIVQGCVQKTYPIPILTALEALRAIQSMDDVPLQPALGFSERIESHFIPHTLHWDSSFVNFLLSASGLPKQPETDSVASSEPLSVETLLTDVFQHLTTYSATQDEGSAVFSPSGHALASLFARTFACREARRALSEQTFSGKVVKEPKHEGQLLRSGGNALTRPSENPSHFALARNAFSSLASTDRTYQGLDMSSAFDRDVRVQSEIALGRAGTPAGYVDIPAEKN